LDISGSTAKLLSSTSALSGFERAPVNLYTIKLAVVN
jgi:hypothetical protein